MSEQQLKDEMVAFRDSKRPTMEFAVDAVTALFAESPELGISPTRRGPDSWTWTEADDRGYTRTYTLAPSAEIDGYPLFTIRQVISARLDSSLATSCVLMGQTIQEIRLRMAVLISNHTGAYAGMTSSIRAINIAGGDPGAGLARALEIHELDGPIGEDPLRAEAN